MRHDARGAPDAPRQARIRPGGLVHVHVRLSLVQAHHLDARRALRRRPHLRAAHRQELRRVGGIGATAARGDRGADGVHELLVTDAHRTVHALQKEVAAAVRVREIRRARVRGDRGRQLQEKRAPRLARRSHFHAVDELFQFLHLRRVRVVRILASTREHLAFCHPARNDTRGVECARSASRCGCRARETRREIIKKRHRGGTNGRLRAFRCIAKAREKAAKKCRQARLPIRPRALIDSSRRAHRDTLPRARPRL